ncbi:Ubiquinone biosynthesis O-methyltransferase [uncultured archaeon]|nr:Ubiquinone biosynthesis O-methyltransferase [uncultured archaeon]
MRSPIYWSGWAYRAAMHAVHGKSLGRRYAHITGFISKGDRVLDVGCGTGTLQSHLKGNEYLGIDLNEDFIRYAKGKKRNVEVRDALKFRNYGDYDVCVMMDFLHHINPKHGGFVKRVLSQVKKKVIICEPFEVPGRHSLAKKFINFIDDDGMNHSGEWMEKGELIRFYEGLHPARIDEISQAVIAVIETKNNGNGGGHNGHRRAPETDSLKT